MRDRVPRRWQTFPSWRCKLSDVQLPTIPWREALKLGEKSTVELDQYVRPLHLAAVTQSHVLIYNRDLCLKTDGMRWHRECCPWLHLSVE